MKKAEIQSAPEGTGAEPPPRVRLPEPRAMRAIPVPPLNPAPPASRLSQAELPRRAQLKPAAQEAAPCISLETHQEG